MAINYTLRPVKLSKDRAAKLIADLQRNSITGTQRHEEHTTTVTIHETRDNRGAVADLIEYHTKFI